MIIFYSQKMPDNQDTKDKEVENLKNGKLTFTEFLYRLLFTREDDLDLLQLLFAAIIIVTLAVTWMAISVVSIQETVKVEALITLRWLAALLILAAVPKWLVPSMQAVLSKNKMFDTSKDKHRHGYEDIGDDIDLSGPEQYDEEPTEEEEHISER